MPFVYLNASRRKPVKLGWIPPKEEGQGMYLFLPPPNKSKDIKHVH